MPAEFVGKARAFRSRIADADAVAIQIIQQTTQQLIERQRRHPVPRTDTLASIARAWRVQVPAFGRASQEITLERKSLSIVEVRTCPQHYRAATWKDDALEPGLIVVRVSLAIAPHEKLSLAMHTLAAISLHGLGRRYQRGADTSDAAIIADIRALAAAHERLVKLPEDTRFDVALPGGRWLGTVLDVRAAASGGVDRILSGRTFVEA